jgi:MFS family permease
LRTMQLTTVFFTIGPAFEALSPNIGIMSFGRFISGLGAGGSVVVVPLYISEIAPPAERGFFGALTQVMVNVGIFTTQLLGYFLSFGQMWRLVLGLGGAIGLAQAIGLLASVESPSWMANNGRAREAETVLQHIRGHRFDIEDEVATWGDVFDDPAGEFTI